MTWTPDEIFEFTGEMDNGLTRTRDVYVKGKGPPIVIIQELPGLGPTTLALIDRLVDQGFKVFAPHLIGPFGKTSMIGNMIRVVCMWREFSIFAGGKHSPIVGFLRALCIHIAKRENCDGVGVIGMCLTGGFALTLYADKSVLAAVASQPALPLRKHGPIDLSEADIKATQTAMAQKGCALGFRYEDDGLSSKASFETLKHHFGDGFEAHDLKGDGHSVLTADLHEPSYQRVLSYMIERLKR